ncbi:hypothetical protein RDI58_000586 [Solanum bulbocastanum]|uniref:Uncharacterized protein n=1 Tax=Solanum bulbocastanum TaxID=147425 RepID=A0AAN8U7P6_SOLBU
MASSPVSELSDGPVLSIIGKHLLALHKKHSRILQMEESRTKGKTLNKEQEEILRSKSVVITAIDELEKLQGSCTSVDAIAGSPRDDGEMRSKPPWTAVDDKCFGGSVD